MSLQQMIRINDVNGCVLANFLALGDGQYFGGRTYTPLKDQPDFGIHSPHMFIWTAGLLDIIARIANETTDSPAPMTLEGHHEVVVIAREMRADSLACALGCSEETIREHYGRLVTLKENAHG